MTDKFISTNRHIEGPPEVAQAGCLWLKKITLKEHEDGNANRHGGDDAVRIILDLEDASSIEKPRKDILS